MHLNLNSLEVQSFTTDPFSDEDTDTVIAPDAAPSDPETAFHPCTKQLTCVGCA